MQKDYESVKKELKSYLKEFLIDSGVKQRGDMFQCVHPHHDDRTPSMSIYLSSAGNAQMHCFGGGCNMSGDIFLAHNMIDNAPLIGYEFITHNIKVLADRFGVDFEPRPMTKEEIEVMNIKSVLNVVRNLVSSHLMNGTPSEEVLEYMDSRDLNRKEHVIQYNLGSVKSWDYLVNELKQIGINEKLMVKSGIESFLFNSHNLLFTVCDEYGHPRGFAARNCSFDHKDNTGSKYHNSRNSLFYNKSQLLYNLHRALMKNVDIHNSLYIVEGYADSTTLDIAGLRATSLGGVAFTEEHILLLQKVGITDVVFLLDGDKPGRMATGSAITKIMEGIRNFRTRIAELPEGEDPDSLVRKSGVDAVHNIPHMSTFEWRLKELSNKTDLTSHEIAKEVIPLIVNERSHIERDRMAEILSERVDIPADTIRKELMLISNDKKLKVKAEQEAIVDNLIKKIRKNPNDVLITLNQGLRSIKEVSERNNLNIFDEKEVLENVSHLEMAQENKEYRDNLFFNRMPRFEKQLDGTISSKFLLLGGEPNTGKSSFFLNVVLNLLRSEEGDTRYGQPLGDLDRRNNLSIIFHSVDDSRKDVVSRLVTILTYENFKKVTINLVSAPYKFRGLDDVQIAFMAARKAAYYQLKGWIKEGRLILKDQSHAATLSGAEMMIEYIRNKYEGRKVIYFLDNIYDLGDYPALDETQRLRVLSRECNHMTDNLGITTISTVEYNKGTHGGNSFHSLNQKISGPKTLEYDAKWVGHLMNPLETDEHSDWYFSEKIYPDGMTPRLERLPIITLRVAKNKITEFKGDIHYFFIPKRAIFIEVNKNNIQMLKPLVRDKIQDLYIDKTEEQDDFSFDLGTVK